MKRILIALVGAAAAAGASASTVTNLVVHSAKMDKNVPVTVVLPDAYDGVVRFPSVYVLHGAGGSNRKADNPVITNLVDRYGFVAIAPDGGKTSWWLDSPIDPKYQYETFVIDELLAVNGIAHTYVEVRAPTTTRSVHGKFYDQGAEICLRFIANYFRDGYGHLGDVKAN